MRHILDLLTGRVYHEHKWGAVEFEVIGWMGKEFKNRRAPIRKCSGCCASRRASRDELCEALLGHIERAELEQKAKVS